MSCVVRITSILSFDWCILFCYFLFLLGQLLTYLWLLHLIIVWKICICSVIIVVVIVTRIVYNFISICVCLLYHITCTFNIMLIIIITLWFAVFLVQRQKSFIIITFITNINNLIIILICISNNYITDLATSITLHRRQLVMPSVTLCTWSHYLHFLRWNRITSSSTSVLTIETVILVDVVVVFDL